LVPDARTAYLSVCLFIGNQIAAAMSGKNAEVVQIEVGRHKK
jgi:hypothetical protein